MGEGGGDGRWDGTAGLGDGYGFGTVAEADNDFDPDFDADSDLHVAHYSRLVADAGVEIAAETTELEICLAFSR